MKTLTTPITTQRDASQSGWSELYDFYLKAPITTPFGVTNVLRVCTNPAGVSFFTPKISPEPAGTQGNAQAYSFWPLKRQTIKGSNKFTNDKLAVAASNVSKQFAQMLAGVDWEAVPVVIRKVSNTIANPTADDCAVIFSGSIDSVKVTAEQLNFTVSNDFGTFNLMAPRENMHANCRFNYGDDQCTQLLYSAANYKSMTVGSGSTATNVKSADLTQDSGSSGSYGTDLVDALADASISASSEPAAFSNLDVTFVPGGFYFSASNPEIGVGSIVTFTTTGTMPTHSGGTPLVAGANYYIAEVYDGGFGKACSLALVSGGSPLFFNSNGSGVKCSTVTGNYGSNVKWSKTGFWAMLGHGDWGTNTQGYWQLPDTDQGLRNGNLKPWVTFDFGTARQMKLWRICGRQDRDREALPRLVLFFSSANNTNWDFETYFEMPPQFGTAASPMLFDVLIPNARSRRYWRICLRTRWSDTIQSNLLYKVRGYVDSRHYWQDGQITFASNTTTPALRNVTRAVRESYNGELVCAALPAAPLSGDTFTIQRGCARIFNACCVRGNWENFGGFDSMPFETVIR